MPYLPAGFQPRPPQPVIHRIKRPEDDLVVYESGEVGVPPNPLKGRHSLEVIERAREVVALRKAGKSRDQVAELLGISKTMASKLTTIAKEVGLC